MKRHALVLLLAGLACGDVDEKVACRTSLDCPTGEWCAAAEGERRCWPDAAPPVASDVTLTCGTTPCLRDGTLRVEAAIADDHEVLSAEATLDLDPARPIALTRSGSRWAADVPLREFPFERFEGPVTARVVGIDGAKTRSAAVESAAVQVTRLRWEYTAAVGAVVSLTSPAVREDGVVVVGGSDGRLYFVDPGGVPSRSPVTVGASQITAAPVIGASGIWVGSRDGRLYRVAPGGDSVNAGCASGGVIPQAAALLSGTPERAAGPSQANAIAVTDGGIFCNLTFTGAPVSAPPVVRTNGQVWAMAGTVAQSFTVSVTGALAPDWTGIPPAPVPPAIGAPVELPLAIDSESAMWSVGTGGQVHRTRNTAETELIATLAGARSGVVFLSDGTAVVGSGSATLSRPTVTDGAWRDSSQLEGLPTTPLVLDAASPGLFVTTSTGRVHSVRQADGTVAWSHTISAVNAPLQPPNIFTPPGQPAGAMLSTAYVAGEDGKLYAVIVDGELDTSSPWPKAFHDPRNTNNAGTQP